MNLHIRKSFLLVKCQFNMREVVLSACKIRIRKLNFLYMSIHIHGLSFCSPCNRVTPARPSNSEMCGGAYIIKAYVKALMAYRQVMGIVSLRE